MLSRICDEFHCLPSQAARELDREPELVSDILMLRSYARTKEQMEHAEDEKDAPKGPMADLVLEIEYALLQERKARVTDGE